MRKHDVSQENIETRDVVYPPRLHHEDSLGTGLPYFDLRFTTPQFAVRVLEHASGIHLGVVLIFPSVFDSSFLS
jgi:hypothetical protein